MNIKNVYKIIYSYFYVFLPNHMTWTRFWSVTKVEYYFFCLELPFFVSLVLYYDLVSSTRTCKLKDKEPFAVKLQLIHMFQVDFICVIQKN